MLFSCIIRFIQLIGISITVCVVHNWTMRFSVVVFFLFFCVQVLHLFKTIFSSRDFPFAFFFLMNKRKCLIAIEIEFNMLTVWTYKKQAKCHFNNIILIFRVETWSFDIFYPFKWSESNKDFCCFSFVTCFFPLSFSLTICMP